MRDVLLFLNEVHSIQIDFFCCQFIIRLFDLQVQTRWEVSYFDSLKIHLFCLSKEKQGKLVNNFFGIQITIVFVLQFLILAIFLALDNNIYNLQSVQQHFFKQRKNKDNSQQEMDIAKQQIKQLYPGIKVKKKMVFIDQQLTYIFSLDVQDLKNIDFQIDFTGSENITLKNMPSHERIVFKTVQPRQSTQIAQVDLHQGWKLVTKFRFRRRPIPKQKQLQYIKGLIDSISSEKKLVQTVLKNFDVYLTPIEDINQILQKNQIKFIDKEFPPEDVSIIGQSDKNLIDDTVNHWRRPGEFFQGKGFALIERINHNNLIKGKLCDNAFYSVLVCLTLTHHSLIERLFFNQTDTNPLGIYRLRLCKNGEWQTITIDDLIPCEPLGQPKFASSTLNEIWIHLLQKAYAKIHKRYLTLHDLQVSNVFNDLTGCPTYIQSLQGKQKNFKKLIVENFKKKNIICFYDIQQKQFDQDEFIPLKHYAYPLLSYQQQDGKLYFKFLSHNHEKQQISQDQMIKKFKYICVCHVKNWEEVRIKGKFVTVEAGSQQGELPISMSKWYYSLDLPHQSQIHVCLHQQDVLIGNNQSFKNYVYCSMLLLQKGEKSILKPRLLKNFTHNRQTQLSLDLQPGIYLIIPFINSQSRIGKPKQEQDLIVDIFRKLDLLMRRQLKYPQLVSFFKTCNQVFDQDIFYQMLKKYTTDRKGIGLDSFRKMWQQNKLYWKDAQDYYLKQRLFTLSIHSNTEINILIKNNIGTQLNNRAHCEIINSPLGKYLELNKKYDKFAKVKYLKSKSNIIEYMVENMHERKIQIELDCSQSVGYSFVPKSGKVQCTLDSGQKQFVMKLIPFEKIQVKDLKAIEHFRVKNAD